MAMSEAGRQRCREAGKKSSRKGKPNKITLEVKETLDALGCNPMELSARIALGEELDGPHPALPKFHQFADKLAELEDKGGAVTAELVEELRSLADDNLSAGYVPIELRSRHINELKKYLYPQRKAIDHTTGGDKLTNLVQVYMPDNTRDDDS